jgi:hypothetical protein
MDLLFQSCARAAYNHPRLNPAYVPANDSKFSIGSAAHSLFLEGNDIVTIVFADDWRTKAAKEERDKAWADGKVPLLEKEFDIVSEMVNAADVALMNSELEIQIDNGDSELSYFWLQDGAWCRCRPDWMTKDRIITLDYKTSARPVNPAEMAGHILNMGYDVQESFYRKGIKAVDGVDTKFCFMFQEIEKPYLCSFVSLAPDFQHVGQMKVSHAIGLWNQCVSTGKWPGYSQRVVYPDLPAWGDMWQTKATFLGDEEEL